MSNTKNMIPGEPCQVCGEIVMKYEGHRPKLRCDDCEPEYLRAYNRIKKRESRARDVLGRKLAHG